MKGIINLLIIIYVALCLMSILLSRYYFHNFLKIFKYLKIFFNNFDNQMQTKECKFAKWIFSTSLFKRFNSLILQNFDQNWQFMIIKVSAEPKILPRELTCVLERKDGHPDINAVSHFQSNFNWVPLMNENEIFLHRLVIKSVSLNCNHLFNKVTQILYGTCKICVTCKKWVTLSFNTIFYR